MADEQIVDYVEVVTDTNGSYRVRGRSDNGQIIWTSEQYDDEAWAFKVAGHRQVAAASAGRLDMDGVITDQYGMIVVPEDQFIRERLRAEATERQRDKLVAVLHIVPLDEWQEYAEQAILDLIEEDVMLKFIAAARVALAESQ